MCSKGTKEHEAILSTDAAPYQIHTGLLLTGAEAGHPVQFVPKFEPPSGSAIAIEVLVARGRQGQEGRRSSVDQGRQEGGSRRDWVFGGSQFYDDPLTKTKRYAAEDGDLITVANFGSAILDLPIESSANDADRNFSTNTEKIPPVGTEVLLSLSPRRVKPAAGKAAAGSAKSR